MESCIDSKSRVQLLRLLGCVTAVCVEDSLIESIPLKLKSNDVSVGERILDQDIPVIPVPVPIVIVTRDFNDLSSSITTATATAGVPLSVSSSVSGVSTGGSSSSGSGNSGNHSNNHPSAVPVRAVVSTPWTREDVTRSLPWMTWRGVVLCSVVDQSISDSNINNIHHSTTTDSSPSSSSVSLPSASTPSSSSSSSSSDIVIDRKSVV